VVAGLARRSQPRLAQGRRALQDFAASGGTIALGPVLISEVRLLWSLRSGGHVGGEDVVGMAVEVLAGAVVAHGGAWVGVAGGLDGVAAPFEQPSASAPSNGCFCRPTGFGLCCPVTLSPDNE
jgi:hypothetical protein